MLDFDEESKRTESEEVAANGKAPDKIDDEYDYEAKYEKTYAKYDFKGSDRFDKTGEYHTDKSYAAQSTNVEQVKKAPRVTAWTTFFKSIPYPLICIVIYLALGFALNAWHPAWVLFLTIPAYYSFIENYITTGEVRFPIFTIVLIAYLLMGFLGKLWHPGWIVFFAWPLYFIFDNLMRIKHTRLIVYTLFCIAIYVVIGATLKIWHPTWLIFLTIPIFESLYNSTVKLIKTRKAEREEKKEKKEESKNDK